MVPTTGVETGDWPLVSKNVNLEKVIPNVIPPCLSHSHSRKIDYSVVAHITVIGHGWPSSSFSPEQFLYSVCETYRGADGFLSLSLRLWFLVAVKLGLQQHLFQDVIILSGMNRNSNKQN